MKHKGISVQRFAKGHFNMWTRDASDRTSTPGSVMSPAKYLIVIFILMSLLLIKYSSYLSIQHYGIKKTDTQKNYP